MAAVGQEIQGVTLSFIKGVSINTTKNGGSFPQFLPNDLGPKAGTYRYAYLGLRRALHL